MKLTNITKASKTHIILIFLTLFGVLFMAVGDNAHISNDDNTQSIDLESKIAQVIMDTYNLNNVSVILTYDTNGEKITSPSNTASQNETHTFVSGAKEPFVISEKLPYVRGVLISAPYINKEVCNDIVNGVSTLLGINPSKVNVIYQKNY